MIRDLFLGFFAIFAFTVAVHAAEQDAPSDAPKALFGLSYADAENAIGHALAAKGAGGKISATIIGQKRGPLYSYTKPISVEIRGLQFDQGSNRWSANLLMLSEGDVISALPVSGRFDEMTEMPVLRHEARNGDVITEADIEVRDFPIGHMRGDAVTDISDLIGKTPRHVISGERPIRTHELTGPAVIKKNALITIRYTAPGMEISTSGQAIENGARGDIINVRNAASKKILRAAVIDEQTVSVVAGGVYAAN